MRCPTPCILILVVAGLLIPGCKSASTSGGDPAGAATDDTETPSGDDTQSPPTVSSGGADVEQGDVYVDLYDPEQTCEGTTFMPDLHDPQNPRIIEVDMQGQVVWEYVIPDDLKQYRDPGMDVEVLEDNRVLLVLPRNGVYEIDRSGTIVWSHLDEKISHDADRLPGGNTLYAWGGGDTKDDAQVKEVTPDGELVWSWHAKDEFDTAPYADISREGWTHTNAVTRLPNGNTLVSLRNFNLTVEVNPQEEVVWQFDWSTLDGDDPHDPEALPNDNLIVCLQHDTPHQVVEIDRATGELVWDFFLDGLRTARDCDRLPNGNTLIQGVLMEGDESILLEVTQEREIVWQLKLKDTPATGSPGWFYKAERVCRE
ncbi:MAG: aryl-sulfate sulfotransferase [Phycisphaerae bacterium]